LNNLKITILGNGGCINDGLPYNSFLVNGNFLIETPPDIMLSLKTLDQDIDLIDTIFISHLHGDHTFGLPFLIINKWMKSGQERMRTPLTILGPNGIEPYVKKITEYAFTTANPCYEWLEQNVTFSTIRSDVAMPFKNLKLSCFGLRHVIKSYGFFLENRHETVFSYIADTTWCRQVEKILERRPQIVFIDMNGGDSNYHISPEEVIEKGLPITQGETTYYGMHLAEEFGHHGAHIQCGKQGEEIVIQY